MFEALPAVRGVGGNVAGFLPDAQASRKKRPPQRCRNTNGDLRRLILCIDNIRIALTVCRCKRGGWPMFVRACRAVALWAIARINEAISQIIAGLVILYINHYL